MTNHWILAALTLVTSAVPCAFATDAAAQNAAAQTEDPKGEDEEEDPKGEDEEEDPKGEDGKEDPKGEDGKEDPKGEDGEEDPKGEDGEESSEDDTSTPSRAKDSRVTAEQASRTWVGVRYRTILAPKFLINLFGEGGKTLLVHSAGPELALRNGLKEFNFGLWLADYRMDPVPFKGTTEPPEAWEIAESEIKILYLTSDFIWGYALSSKLTLNYGVGAGLGLVFGDLKRTQAYPGAGADRATGDGFKPCVVQKEPDRAFCGEDNDHYLGYTEPSWANGGSKPNVFPWLTLQTGLRYAFSPKFAARLDLGFGTSGFFFGIGGDYGL